MKKIKGPGIYLMQFLNNEKPFNNLKDICNWAASLGFKGVQIPVDNRLIDIQKAAESKTYADEIKGIVEDEGMEIIELCTHLQGQLVAVHPAYDKLFAEFGPAEYKNDPAGRTEWAVNTVKQTIRALNNLGLSSMVTFSGAFLWHTMYPWPARPKGLVNEGFKELARRWKPILDYADQFGIDVCYEIHPGEDLHDGVTYERFLQATGNHNRANLLYDPSHLLLQCIDYLEYIDIYHEKIKSFHVKDAELNPTGRSGVYGGYQDWIDRAGRFRSLGDGQVDFKGIFSKLTQYDYGRWATMEWECCLKHPEDGASEGAEFIKRHLIRVTEHAFDDFAGAGGSDENFNREILGLE